MNVFEQAIVWSLSNDPDFPYIAKMNGVTMKIRINDFPAEPLYTLMAAEVAQDSFDDWPSNWVRPEKK